ncbi:MAG: hypothetical protein NZ455_16350 [Bacteroidia bacterium]|nr:hypothetical protein [Bacteroidia bacterium]
MFGRDTEFDSLDISQRPKTYFPHRTKATLKYHFGKDLCVELENVQIEIDLTIEFEGIVGVFEAKNGSPSSFAVYQIYHPFLYYHNANQSPGIMGKIKKIYGVYVIRNIELKGTCLKIWATLLRILWILKISNL